MKPVTILGVTTLSAAFAAFLLEVENLVEVIRTARNRKQAMRRPVLISGETGVGKEWVFRLIARSVPLTTGEPVDLSGLTEGLAESELYGHNRGAFSGATKDRKGLFRSGEQALFIDEVGKASLTVQARLLRVLENRRVRAVGADRGEEIDAVLIALAACEDLEQLVARERFREDLYHRIKPLELRVPPLRARIEDLELLVRAHLATIGALSTADIDGAVAAWSRYAWPGNIRELMGAIERCATLWGGLDGDTARRWLEENGVELPSERRPSPVDQRRGEVRALLLKHDRSAAELAEILDVSSETIRGDLAAIEALAVGAGRSTRYTLSFSNISNNSRLGDSGDIGERANEDEEDDDAA